ncbi:hypothetical protein GHT06_018069 [Daphnia sinensis]|uniref:Uncharacterized protein n=1 Tax=Daphnia sinensis TaxID=1820382 RepID=A0AAD5PSS1_9CRUS|nr:hypothetical protein GHT06_018069 [Daphnia sinensis]
MRPLYWKTTTDHRQLKPFAQDPIPSAFTRLFNPPPRLMSFWLLLFYTSNAALTRRQGRLSLVELSQQKRTYHLFQIDYETKEQFECGAMSLLSYTKCRTFADVSIPFYIRARP